MSDPDKHSFRSSEREEYVEYIFLAKVCSHAWLTDRFVEVSRAQTDAYGYDLVLSSGGVTRHVQLKATRADGKASFQKVSTALGAKASGCVVWMKVNSDNLEPEQYGWFGGLPNEKLPDIGERIAKHTKGDSDGVKTLRGNHREVPWRKFTKLNTANEVFDKLFG